MVLERVRVIDVVLKRIPYVAKADVGVVVGIGNRSKKYLNAGFVFAQVGRATFEDTGIRLKLSLEFGKAARCPVGLPRVKERDGLVDLSTDVKILFSEQGVLGLLNADKHLWPFAGDILLLLVNVSMKHVQPTLLARQPPLNKLVKRGNRTDRAGDRGGNERNVHLTHMNSKRTCWPSMRPPPTNSSRKKFSGSVFFGHR